MFKKIVGVVTECDRANRLVKVKVVSYKREKRYGSISKKEKIIRARDSKSICSVNQKVILLPTRKLTSTVSHKVLATILV